MPGLSFWSTMTKRAKAALRLDDKLMVGKQDQSDPQHTDLQDLRDFMAVKPLVLNGYRVSKHPGNENEADWEVYDKFDGIGEWFPGYAVSGYILNAPVVNPATDTLITQSQALP